MTLDVLTLVRLTWSRLTLSAQHTAGTIDDRLSGPTDRLAVDAVADRAGGISDALLDSIDDLRSRVADRIGHLFGGVELGTLLRRCWGDHGHTAHGGNDGGQFFAFDFHAYLPG